MPTTSFSLKSFLKRLAGKQFFKKGYDHAHRMTQNEIRVNQLF
jgi:hypothetical protein